MVLPIEAGPESSVSATKSVALSMVLGAQLVASLTSDHVLAEKISRLREMDPRIEIEVDGGIDAKSAPLVVRAGATVLVAGSSVYGHKQGVAAGIKAIRDALD